MEQAKIGLKACQLCGKEIKANEDGTLNEVRVIVNNEIKNDEYYFDVNACEECCKKFMDDVRKLRNEWRVLSTEP